MRLEGEKGYSLFFFQASKAWARSVTTLLLGGAVAGGSYLVYSSLVTDRAPDSWLGLIYALGGTICLISAALGFTLRRRSRKRRSGQLNASLNWHICLGLFGLTLIFLHSFGNFNPRSGTYALYSMIALAISGLIGRLLDRWIPRLMAEEVRKALTVQGEDRIESISQRLRSIVVHNTQELRTFKTDGMASMAGFTSFGQEALKPGPKPPQSPGSPTDRNASIVLQTPWDLAYISLEELPQEIGRDAPQHRFVPDKKSPLAQSGALLPGAREHMSELNHVQNALQREQFYRYIIRYWRLFHLALALLTIGLTIWHLEYAIQLLIPVWLHR